MTITHESLPELEYDVYSGSSTLSTLDTVFNVVSVPIADHGLCGAIVKTASYNNQTLDAINGPMKTFDSSTNEFTVESDDPTLFGATATWVYAIHAEFANYAQVDYAGVTTAYATSIISFGNECLDSVLTATT